MQSQTLKMVSTYYKYSWTWTFQDTHLKVGLKGQPPFISVNLYRPVKTEDCFWSIGWTIHFYTFDQAKSDGMVEILQKMMFEQWQKAMGLPTSDDK
ncbi:unnamed protein product [Musa acuminata subsp. malaccensis]|uniref:(wild Malaysian banana) hypothetical protein n=1 Tax=Musa acuminata subsp. malaccensis TaxID=214687 RepID=A0A804HUA7_MUSAM|nr:unnamed protein product [Musa acuminata subsp. malaccensis]